MNMPINGSAIVDHAITSRRSIRRFLPTLVPAATVEAILDAAARAPSGTNMQPWRGYVVAGAAKQALVDAVRTAFDAGGSGMSRRSSTTPTVSSNHTCPAAAPLAGTYMVSWQLPKVRPPR